METEIGDGYIVCDEDEIEEVLELLEGKIK